MGLMENMSQGTMVKRIPISDIRQNQNNKYGLREIKELALLIQKQGQMENATVYFDTNVNDGKHYTLIGGNRRYKAIEYLSSIDKHDGYLDCKITEKPVDEIEEKELIIVDNAQREKSIEERKWEVQVGLEMYNRDKPLGKVPTGMKARDYIGSKIGLSGRQVQNILAKIKETDDKAEQKEKKKEKEIKIEDVEKLLIKIQKDILKAKNYAELCDAQDYLKQIEKVISSVDETVSWFSNE